MKHWNDSLAWGDPPLGIYTLPLILADARGELQVTGRHIRFESNLTGKDYAENLLKEKFDIGQMGTPPYLNAMRLGAPYTIIAQGAYQTPPFYLVTSPEVKSPIDLVGKKVAINKRETCPHSIISNLMHLAGKSAEDLEILTLVTAEMMVQAAEAKKLQGVVIWEPFVSYLERTQGWHVLASATDVIQPSNYGFYLYAHNRLLQEEPGLVREVVQLMRNIYGEAFSKRDELASLWQCIPMVQRIDVEMGLQRDMMARTIGQEPDMGLLELAIEEASRQAGESIGLRAENLVDAVV